MPSSLPPILLDAALRGTLIALLLLLALMLQRDRPGLLAARAGVAMAIGLCVQVIGSTPLFEAEVPRLWQAPFVAISVGNGVLFWIFVQALFDDEFAWKPLHFAAWLAVAAVSGINCAVIANSASVLAPWTMGIQRAVPLLFAVLAAIAAASNWRADLVEGRRTLRAFIVVTGIVYTLVALAIRLGSPQGRVLSAWATVDVVILLVIVAVVVVRMLRFAGSELFPRALPAHVDAGRRIDGLAGRARPAPSASPAPSSTRPCRRAARP
jgi:hypothetical protein